MLLIVLIVLLIFLLLGGGLGYATYAAWSFSPFVGLIVLLIILWALGILR